MRQGIMCGAVLLSVLLSACSTMRVTTPVEHPAEVDMRSYDKVAIMDIDGSYGQHYRDSLKARLASGHKFELLDCKQLERKVTTQEEVQVPVVAKVVKKKKKSDLEKGVAIFGALKSKASDAEKVTKVVDVLTDEGAKTASAKPAMETKLVTKVSIVKEDNPACSAEKLRTAALISGRVDGEYVNKVTKAAATCVNSDKKEYACTNYTRKANLTTNGTIDLTDASSGEIIRSRPVAKSCGRDTSATNKQPAAVTEDELRRKCIEPDTMRFAKTITPWTEYVKVAYRKDGDLPDLEAGVKHVELGKYGAAIQAFQKAIKRAESKKMDADVIAKAYWNLALAYEYSWQFDESLAALDKAYMLDDDKEYLAEKSNVTRLQASRKKLLEQSSFTEN